MHKSLWQETFQKKAIQKKSFPSKTDILIIGGGITGISAASFLENSGKKVVLIEKGKLYQGITAKTTAKISYLQKDIYGKLLREQDALKSYSYYLSQKEAISLFLEQIKTKKIHCDLEQVPSILFAVEPSNIEKVKKEEALLKKWGQKTKSIKHPKISYGFCVEDTYTFHPLKYLEALVQEFPDTISVFEDTLAFQINQKGSEYQVLTTKGEILASSVVLACHYPFFLFPSLIPIKTYMKREYVNVSLMKELSKIPFTAINVDKKLHSIRFYNENILYGSYEHLLINLSENLTSFSESQKNFQKIWKVPSKMTWLNQDIYSHDSLPIIGCASKKQPHLFLATAYGGWGMTNGCLAGKILADLINKGTSPYQSLFSPTRKSVTFFLNSMVGSLGYLKPYIQPLFSKKTVSQVKINGEKYNLYIDDEKRKHLILSKCPHMKCPLIFNEDEKTWDCPCHGSRFDLDGNLLFAPSKQKNGKEKKIP